MSILDSLKAKAKADKKTIVLPESMDKRTFEAAEKILKEGLANLIIIGKWALIFSVIGITGVIMTFLPDKK